MIDLSKSADVPSQVKGEVEVSKIIAKMRFGVVDPEIDDEDLEFCFDDDLVTEDLRCDGETVRRTDSSSSLELTYRHGRLFRVPRLAFESRLRASALSLSLGDYDAEGGELLWDNRLDYRIGKLEVRMRGVIAQRKADDSGNKLFLLSVTRWF